MSDEDRQKLDDFYHRKLPTCLLDADAVGFMLQVTPDSVRHMHQRGQLVGKKCGGGLRWLPEQVAAFSRSLFEGPTHD